MLRSALEVVKYLYMMRILTAAGKYAWRAAISSLAWRRGGMSAVGDIFRENIVIMVSVAALELAEILALNGIENGRSHQSERKAAS